MREAHSGAQAVHRALQVLEALATGHASLSLTDVSRVVGLTIPTTHRLLRALQAHEMVIVDEETRHYSLGPALLRFAAAVLGRNDLVAVAQPVLNELRSKTAETVALHWLVGEQRVCLSELPSPHPIRMESGIGRAYPLHLGAAGKAMLAWSDPDDVARILSQTRHAGFATQARKALLAELTVIEAQGFAVSVGETVAGAAAVAAPLLDAGKRPIGAINVTGPVDRIEPRVGEIAPHVVLASRRIMSYFGAGASIPSGDEFASSAG